MIVSASRRGDIVAYYAPWFMNRLREGYVLVQNPYHKNHYTKITLTPAVVDCIVFWTKNPMPILEHLQEIDDMGYRYYFQFTLTPYGKEIERGVPDKEVLLKAFSTLSEKIENDRVIWRYDPILINSRYSTAHHIQMFSKMARRLKGMTKRCVISFVDVYSWMSAQTKSELCSGITKESMECIAEAFGQIAKENGMQINTCAEEADLSSYGIGHGACIDPTVIEEIINCSIEAKKDKNQRPACGCIESVDIGAYDSCPGGCRYCYATKSQAVAEKNRRMHVSASPSLIGTIGEKDKITERQTESLVSRQRKMW